MNYFSIPIGRPKPDIFCAAIRIACDGELGPLGVPQVGLPYSGSQIEPDERQLIRR